MHFYEFSAQTISGRHVSMESFRGKVILVVNTASKCVFTSQYSGLETLYQKYQQQGLVILGFPCNQFGNQEYIEDKQIWDDCITHYQITFPIFTRVEVNGGNAHPLFTFLKAHLPGNFCKMIKWNFTKFLLDKDGNPIQRFSSITAPEKIEADIIRLL